MDRQKKAPEEWACRPQAGNGHDLVQRSKAHVGGKQVKDTISSEDLQTRAAGRQHRWEFKRQRSDARSALERGPLEASSKRSKEVQGVGEPLVQHRLSDVRVLQPWRMI